MAGDDTRWNDNVMAGDDTRWNDNVMGGRRHAVE
jgi:hypothetical protein